MSIFDKPVVLNNLRVCQKLAYRKLIEHFSKNDAEKHVLIQLPTGTGKSALIAATPFGLSKKRILILTPNVKLSKQLAYDLDIIENPQDNVYKKFGILSKKDLEDLELFVLRLEGSINSSDIDEHQIIVANYHQLNDIEKWFEGKVDCIDLVIIDEAHHQSANTYQEIIKYFSGVRIIGLTATPFRSDGKKVDGLNIYTYHFYEAIKEQYIRNIKAVNIAPEEILLSFNNAEDKIYTLENILKLKEERWFNQGIALSQDCCNSIAEKSLEKLNELRSKFPQTKHQIIASAMSIRHAREFVKPAFERLGLNVGMVSSENEEDNDIIFDKLKYGKIDVIIHINMLGEGFDHPQLGVAAIFRPYKSLNPYIQFIGRVIRKNEPSKYCYVVSHMGLNQISRFKEFKLFDEGDAEFFEKLFRESKNNFNEEISFLGETDTDNIKQEKDLRIKEIGNNIIDFESNYVKQDNVNNLIKMVNDLPEELQKAFFKKLSSQFDNISVKEKKKVKPVNKRKASRNLLNEKEKSITTDIINKLGLKMFDRNFNPLYPNFKWVKQKVSKEVNKCLNISKNERKSLTNEIYKDMEQNGTLDKVFQSCLAYFKEKLNEN